MPNKLFIGNLAFSITDTELTDVFSKAGISTTSVKVMRERDTGRSRGFGFAELAPGTDMESAIQQLNGQMLEGRPLTVNEARQEKPRGFEHNRQRFGHRGDRGRAQRPRRGF